MRKPRPTSAGLGFIERPPGARRQGSEKLETCPSSEGSKGQDQGLKPDLLES